jgi:thiol-disulfide isomerase/thioredoxin
LYSNNEDERSSKLLDSVAFKHGTFVLTGKLAYPQMLSVVVDPGNWSFQVFAENADMQIKGDTAGSSYFDYTKYGYTKGAKLKNFTVTGSEGQDVLTAYNNDTALKRYDPVMDDLEKALTAEKNVDVEYRIRDRIDSVRKMKTALQMQWINHYVTLHPSSVAGVYLFSDLYRFNSTMPVPELDSILKKFSGPATATHYYRSLASSLAKRKALMPGNQAPDFTLLKRDSTPLTLSSTRGRYVMLDFWASWCYPCRKAIPHWKEVYAKYHADGLDIISISDDDRWKNWFKAMDKENMPWLQVCDEFPIKNFPAKVGTLYMTDYIPFYVLLDKEGKILVYTGDEKEMDKKLAELFNVMTDRKM